MGSNGGSKRGKNFTTAEEKLVVLGYLHVSQDPIIGNGQKGNLFWQRVHEYFEKNRVPGSEKRPQKSLEGKWVQIRKDTQKFAGCFDTIVTLDESGTSFEQQVEKALALYKGKHPKLEDFPYFECWLILRHVPRWAEISTTARKTTPLADITNGQSPLQGNMGANGNSPTGRIDTPSSGDASPEESPGINRPQGSKKAKEAVKRQKTIDDSVLKQAEATSQLTATMLERVFLMKEQAMMVSFAMKDDDGRISSEGQEFFRLKRRRDLARFKRDLEVEESSFAPQHHEPSMPPVRQPSPLNVDDLHNRDEIRIDRPTAQRTRLFPDDTPGDGERDTGYNADDSPDDEDGEQSPGYNRPGENSWLGH